jgi:hypothetical protein
MPIENYTSTLKIRVTQHRFYFDIYKNNSRIAKFEEVNYLRQLTNVYEKMIDRKYSKLYKYNLHHHQDQRNRWIVNLKKIDFYG